MIGPEDVVEECRLPGSQEAGQHRDRDAGVMVLRSSGGGHFVALRAGKVSSDL